MQEKTMFNLYPKAVIPNSLEVNCGVLYTNWLSSVCHPRKWNVIDCLLSAHN